MTNDTNKNEPLDLDYHQELWVRALGYTPRELAEAGEMNELMMSYGNLLLGIKNRKKKSNGCGKGWTFF